MATNTVIPVSEYLSTTYRPDCDYVDGEVQERNLGERDHADLQSRLVFLLCQPENAQHVTARSELRVQVSSTRFRVPDVCVLRKGAPRDQIVIEPPLLCIEVLSPEDTMRKTRQRVRDFLSMGVLEVWIVDPAARSISVCTGSTMVENSAGALTVPGTPVVLELAGIFQVLDES